MSDANQDSSILRSALDLLKHNWLTIVLLGVLGYVLVTDRYPAWRQSRAMEGKPAADFVFNDLSGRPVRLSDYRGKKVLLNFWATWCLPCRLEIPLLRGLHQELSDQNFVMLSITNEQGAHVRAFAKSYELDYPILLDPRDDSRLKFQVDQYPTMIWIDEEGRIDDVSTGLNPLLRWKVRREVTGNPF